MLSYINSMKTYFKSLNKFQWGQLLFILSWCPGVFLHDTVRKILIAAALCCLSKDKIRESFDFVKTKVPGFLPLSLIIFWSWLLFVPLFFGAENLTGRLQGLGWPIEIIIFMFAAFIYARDEFFVKTFRKCFLVSLFLFLAGLIIQRASTGFAVNYENWIFCKLAYRVGCLLSWMLPISVYYLMNEKNRLKASLIFILAFLSAAMMVITFYTTFWLVLFVELTVMLLLFICFNKINKIKIILKSAAIIIFAGFMLFILASYHPATKATFDSQIEQITSISLEQEHLEKFTNHRYGIWLDAFHLIKERPLTGYGWHEFSKYSKDGYSHAHSALIQAAWSAGIPAAFMLMFILIANLIYSLRFIIRNHKITLIPYVIFMTITAYFTIGLVEDIFRASRMVVFAYWIVLTLPLTPVFYFKNNN